MKRMVCVLILLVSMLVSVGTVSASPSWVLVGDTYLIEGDEHWYGLTSAGTWDEAQSEACQIGSLIEGYSGSLVTIETAEENAWLLSMFSSPGLEGNVWGLVPQLWIGARDVDVEGVWVWTDGSDADGDTAPYSNWGIYEPTSDPGGIHDGNPNLDCDWATLRLDEGLTWNDYNVTGWSGQGYGVVQGIVELTPVPVPGALLLGSVGVLLCGRFRLRSWRR